MWCADINLDRARETVQTIGESGAPVWEHHLDVAQETDWEGLFRRVTQTSGRVDIVVNSAGISAASPLEDTNLEEWRRVLAINLDGAFLGTKHAIRALKQDGGSIVNVSSASAIKAAAGAAAYSVSKAGICMLSRTAAKECRDKGYAIRVNTVCPGAVKTPLWRTMPFFRDLVEQTGSEDAAFQEMATNDPGGRFADPIEIARAVLYLASEQSSFVTGENLVIDAGFVL